jgi:hypothetical protein
MGHLTTKETSTAVGVTKPPHLILTRRLAAAEGGPAGETAKAEGAIAELSAIAQLRARAAR